MCSSQNRQVTIGYFTVLGPVTIFVLVGLIISWRLLKNVNVQVVFVNDRLGCIDQEC